MRDESSWSFRLTSILRNNTRLIGRSWAARLPTRPPFTYGFKIRVLLLLGPASIELRVLAFWDRAGFSHINQRGSLNTFSQSQGTSRGKSWTLIEELSVAAGHAF